jgi:hypothetical protein
VGSQPGGAHATPLVDWIAVYVMLVGAILLGLALPLKSWWIALAGLIVGLIGAGLAIGYGIMNNTEDYEMQPRPDDSQERPQTPKRQRITSA